MTASFRCYIDESGCEGFKFGGGSSRWFLQSAVIVRIPNDYTIIGKADAVRKKIGMPAKKPVHGKDLKHDQKVLWATELSSLNIRCIAVAVDKTALLEPEKFQKSYRLYFYSLRYLLERVSWLARDAGAGDYGDGTVDLILSNRGGMRYAELDDYVSVLKRQRESGKDVRIEFDYLDVDKRKVFRPGKYAGLQAADAFAGAVFNALEPNRFGFVESRYLTIFMPVIYRSHGEFFGYGIKISPREAITGIKHTEFYKVINAGPGP